MSIKGLDVTQLNILLESKCSPRDQAEVNLLVEACFIIALRYLSRNYKKIVRHVNLNQISPEDIAIDAVSQIFTPDQNGEFPSLKKSFLKWTPEIKSLEDFVFFLQNVVATKVDHQITIILKEDDLFFGKILTSVLYLMKKQNFKKKYFLGKLYIVNTNNGKITTPIITNEEIENIPLPFLTNISFDELFQYIITRGYSPALPLNKFIYRLKHLVFSNYETGNTPITYLNEIELRNVVESALEEIKNRIIEKYFFSGKLNEAETDAMVSSIKDISIDLRDGGISGILFSYLAHRMPGLTKKEYKEKYKNIFEYVYKDFKYLLSEKLNDVE